MAIRQNYAGLYGVDELARQLGVSKSHLVRVFTAQMGIGPGQYLIQTRVDAAKVLLAQRDYSLDVVASLCGFSGANYLCKVFKSIPGKRRACSALCTRDRCGTDPLVGTGERAVHIDARLYKLKAFYV